MDTPVNINIIAHSIVPYNKAGRLPTYFNAQIANKENVKLVIPT